MERLKKSFPEAWTTKSPTTRRFSCAKSIQAVGHTFVESADLGRDCVLVFCNVARVPSSAAGASRVASGNILNHAGAGFSLNTLSLFGLVLAIGIVVDDAIVLSKTWSEISLGTRTARSYAPSDGRIQRTDRGIALVLCRCLSDGVHRWTFGAVLQAVRADHRYFHRDFSI